MADPFTIVGLAASILHLVDFSSKVIARLNDFHSKLKKIPKCFQDINAQLPALQEALQHTKGRIDNGSFENSTNTALLPAIVGCKNQVEALDKLLADIIPAVGDSSLKKTQKPLSSIKKESKVEVITKALGSYIATLTFYYVAASSTLQPGRDTKLVEIRHWLSSSDASINLNKATKLREPNTGLWLLEKEVYKNWKRKESPFIWLHGIPGCGKTIISSTITHDILDYSANDPGKVVAYFFFDFTDAEKQSPEFMIRSLISQLSEKSIEMPPDLESLYLSSDRGNRQPSLDALTEVLYAMLWGFPRSYLILDALDECKNRALLIEILEKMANWQLENMHVLFTSRKERGIETSLEAIINKDYIIGLESQVVDKDIEKYVRRRLSTDKGLLKWQKVAEISREIETTLMHGSRGMFRWAVCQMDALRDCRSRSALQKALKTLPTTLDETYERKLCTISKDDFENAVRILRWLAFSIRPLTLKELAEVVSIDLEREPAIDRDEILEDPMDVLNICSSLVSMVESENSVNGVISWTVTLAHYSVQEYLVSDRICRGQALRYKLNQLPSPLYIASLGGLAIPASLLVQDGANVNAQGSLYGNALQVASLVGHDKIVELLLSHGADINAQGGLIDNALSAASSKGHDKTVELLLSKGADANAQGPRYCNALAAASLGGHDKIVELLLGKGVDVNAQGGYYDNALSAASWGGHDKIAELLLSHGADANSQGRHYSNALSAASLEGHNKTVELLLGKGVDINAQGGYYDSALSAASWGGNHKTIELLLSQGADVNAQGHNFGNALLAAICKGYDKIIELLLSRGADINAQGGPYGNALSAASYWGQDRTLKLLLERGAEIEAKDESGKTALINAAIEGDKFAAKILIENGALVEAKDNEGRSALAWAILKQNRPVERLLLENGADTQAIRANGWTLLKQVAPKESDVVVHLLLGKGTDLKVKNNNGKTALAWAAAENHVAMLRQLILLGGKFVAKRNRRKSVGF